MRLPTKLPDEIWIDSFDFVKQLADGDTIVSCRADKKSGDITLSGAAVSGSKVTVTIAGGTLGETAEFWVLATTEKGETLGEAITLQIAGAAL